MIMKTFQITAIAVSLSAFALASPMPVVPMRRGMGYRRQANENPTASSVATSSGVVPTVSGSGPQGSFPSQGFAPGQGFEGPGSRPQGSVGTVPGFSGAGSPQGPGSSPFGNFNWDSIFNATNSEKALSSFFHGSDGLVFNATTVENSFKELNISTQSFPQIQSGLSQLQNVNTTVIHQSINTMITKLQQVLSNSSSSASSQSSSTHNDQTQTHSQTQHSPVLAPEEWQNLKDQVDGKSQYNYTAWKDLGSAIKWGQQSGALDLTQFFGGAGHNGAPGSGSFSGNVGPTGTGGARQGFPSGGMRPPTDASEEGQGDGSEDTDDSEEPQQSQPPRSSPPSVNGAQPSHSQ